MSLVTNLARGLRTQFLLCGLLVAHAFAAVAPSDLAYAEASPPPRDGQHDFDFEFGSWDVHVRRLLRPLTGSTTWVDYRGTSVVRRVWSGRANLGEIDMSGPAGRIEGLSLRLYDPGSGRWNISWANAADGALTPPLVGGFKDGRGEFFNEDTLNGRPIRVRFHFTDLTETSFRLEQAFSGDGGKTWEPNWIATFARASGESGEGR
jgi:hypothetical protein